MAYCIVNDYNKLFLGLPLIPLAVTVSIVLLAIVASVIVTIITYQKYSLHHNTYISLNLFIEFIFLGRIGLALIRQQILTLSKIQEYNSIIHYTLMKMLLSTVTRHQVVMALIQLVLLLISNRWRILCITKMRLSRR